MLFFPGIKSSAGFPNITPRTFCTVREIPVSSWLRLFNIFKNNKVEKSVNTNFSLGSFRRENRTTFSGIPFIPEIFQWNEPKSHVPFSSQPKFTEVFGKWKTLLSHRTCEFWIAHRILCFNSKNYSAFCNLEFSRSQLINIREKIGTREKSPGNRGPDNDNK